MSKSLTPVQHVHDVAQSFFTRTELILPEDLSFEDWSALGKSLQETHRAIHWWIGDWIRFGERKWGERYAQAVEETPFAYQTLANDVWVASAIESSRRRENLTFGHHAIVAALPPEEQDEWLEKAEQEGLNRRQLWEAMKSLHPKPAVFYAGPATLFHDRARGWSLVLPIGVELKADSGDIVRITVKKEGGGAT